MRLRNFGCPRGGAGKELHGEVFPCYKIHAEAPTPSKPYKALIHPRSEAQLRQEAQELAPASGALLLLISPFLAASGLQL